MRVYPDGLQFGLWLLAYYDTTLQIFRTFAFIRFLFCLMIGSGGILSLADGAGHISRVCCVASDMIDAFAIGHGTLDIGRLEFATLISDHEPKLVLRSFLLQLDSSRPLPGQGNFVLLCAASILKGL